MRPETQGAGEDGGQLALKEGELSMGRRKLECCLQAKTWRNRPAGIWGMTARPMAV